MNALLNNIGDRMATHNTQLDEKQQRQLNATMREMERLKQENNAATVEARNALLAERNKGVEEIHTAMDGAQWGCDWPCRSAWYERQTE